MERLPIETLCIAAYEQWDEKIIIRCYQSLQGVTENIIRRRYMIVPYPDAVAVIDQASGELVASVCG